MNSGIRYDLAAFDDGFVEEPGWRESRGRRDPEEEWSERECGPPERNERTDVAQAVLPRQVRRDDEQREPADRPLRECGETQRAVHDCEQGVAP